MSSRDRRRSDRRKRKQRSARRAAQPAPGEAAPGEDGHAGPAPTDLAAEAEARGTSRSELKNQAARESLEPLAPGERPRVVTAGALLSIFIAVVTVGAWIVGAEVDGERPNAIQVFAPAILFGVMGWGMWRARYWAVLGFQAVMAIILVGAFLTLVSATGIGPALTALAVLAVAGTFFWFMVRAMARIQMPDKHLPR